MKIDPHPSAPPATPLDARFWDARDLEHELRRVFEICHSCRMCVGYCGSFPDLFARVDRDIEKKGTSGAEALDAADFASVTELCWQCKLCYIKCPYTADEGHDWLVDVPALLTREKAQRARRNGVTLQDRALGEPQALGMLGSGPAAPLMNFVNANRLVRKVNEKLLGISSEFPLPTFAPRSFERWLTNHVPLERAGNAGTVALFATCTGDYNYPGVPANAVRVLEHNGYAVVRPEQTCCGMPNLDGGDIDSFLAKAKANVASLVEEVRRGRDVVVAQPTCSYTLKREYPSMLGSADAREVAAHTFDLMEYLDRLRRQKKLDTVFKKGVGRVAYHAPCHMRAQKFGAPGARLLGLLPDTKVEVIEQCSAVDGTWGMKAQYYEMGRRYARKLTDRVDGAKADLVVSDCSLAALRIQKESGVKVMHPIESLADAYGIAVALQDPAMKHVVRSEILDIGEYEKIREHFRARVIQEKKHRRVAVGPSLTVLFENHDTVLLQVQEMLRTERITREASVLHEIETYNELLGGPGELGATVMIGVADATERDAFLVRAKGIERHLVLDIDGHAVRATWDPLRVLPDQASAVLYVKFALPEAARAALQSGKAEVAFVVDHPDVALRAPVARDVVASLAEDLGDVSVAAAPFVFDRPVRFDEVDAATILFFARFFNYAHDAMEAFFGQLPGGYVKLINERKIGLPAVHVEADFKSPLRFGDVARIAVTIDRVGKSSCAFRHTMTRKHDATPVAVVKHVCAAVHLETMRSLPLPDDMRALLAAHLVPAPPPAT